MAVVVGDNGAGKTTLVRALCHRPEIIERFTDGFLYVSLRSQPDTCTMLGQLYHTLTDKARAEATDEILVRELRQLVGKYFCNMLVVIDDAHDPIESELYARAFSTCRLVITTAVDDVCNQLSPLAEVRVGEMKENEAVSLLTYKVVEDLSSLPKESVSRLQKFANDLLLWPLILFTVRGQFIFYLKYRNTSSTFAIDSVEHILYSTGLLRSDKSNPEHNTEKNRHHTLKICINATKGLLDDMEDNRFMTVVFYMGVGLSIPQSVVQLIWEFDESETESLLDKLQSCGLVVLLDLYLPNSSGLKRCVAVNPVVCRYLIGNTDSMRVMELCPKKYCLEPAVDQETRLSWRHTGTNPHANNCSFLKYTLSRIDHHLLTYQAKYLCRIAFFDPHFVVYQMLCLRLHIKSRLDLIPSDKAQSIRDECEKIWQDLPDNTRVFERKFNRCLFANDPEAIHTLFEEHCTNHPSARMAEKCIELFDEVAPFCHNFLAQWINGAQNELRLLTQPHNEYTNKVLPLVRLCLDFRKQITESLTSDSIRWEPLVRKIKLDFEKEMQSVKDNYAIRCKEILRKETT